MNFESLWFNFTRGRKKGKSIKQEWDKGLEVWMTYDTRSPRHATERGCKLGDGTKINLICLFFMTRSCGEWVHKSIHISLFVIALTFTLLSTYAIGYFLISDKSSVWIYVLVCICTDISAIQNITLDRCLVRLLFKNVINVQYPETVMFDHWYLTCGTI